MSKAIERAQEMSVYDPDCVSRAILEHATGRWGSLVLVSLADGPLRFTQIRRQVAGIGDRMLSQTLQRLDADGLISRTELSAIPPHVEYALTELGRPIADRIGALIETIYEQLPGIVAHHYAHPQTAPGNPAPQMPGAPDAKIR
ncbi:winged helix-turn-helix transcriptional regulator [Propionicicella superfundia]|uniref:winged helix-turn-helix transcriptional regulator n=1 Tax=Propionicicella superfundia TaxID=348582 RepID=UPI0004131684|nr:helix-turn-helix domain-containing protein [Propionicicella superfundia]